MNGGKDLVMAGKSWRTTQPKSRVWTDHDFTPDSRPDEERTRRASGRWDGDGEWEKPEDAA